MAATGGMHVQRDDMEIAHASVPFADRLHNEYPDLAKLKVAIVHPWLLSMRGGEKVVEQLCLLFPQADLYTLVCREEELSQTIRAHRIETSFLQRLPFGAKVYKSLLPLMPLAIEQFDLNGYDLVISSDTNVTKGVVTAPDVLHICYCNTPMRYVWDLYFDYLKETRSTLKRGLIRLFASYLRTWDVAASNRVDHFIANSKNVQKRIAKHYRRKSTVIYPPVSVSRYRPASELGDYYLYLGQLVAYKRVDLAVEAFNASGKKLLIIGEGPERKALESLAKSNVRLMGFVPQEELSDYLSRCQAFIFPGEEDFGIAPLEAQASGRPVIAFRKGGALETVVEGVTGLFFDEQTAGSLQAAIDVFESGRIHFDPAACVDNAKRFSEEVFISETVGFLRRARADLARGDEG